MNQSAQSLERRRLREVAREYAGQGYKVRLHPGEADLPRFLSSFRPALIAYGPDENVVAEVKSKSTLSESEYLAAFASAAADMPGWRLDLVVTNPKHAPVVDNGAEELDQAEVEARIKAVRELWAVHQEDAAILLAWSAIEAAMRLVAKRESIELENDQPAFVLKKLFSLGLLGREDFAL